MRPVIGLAVASVMLLAAACAEVDRRPATAAPPAQTIMAEGLALTALGGRWTGFPPDLERYYIPIEVVIKNDRKEAVPLRLEDFTLLDASGRERAAVAPREATAALFGSYGRRSALDAPAASGAAAEGALGEASAGAAAIVPARSSFFFSGHFGFPPYYPYSYPYYGPPPGYSYSYPYGRDGARLYADLTGDLVRFGLAEGKVKRHASVRGFLYFPREEGELTGLRLRWSPPVLTGAPLVAPITPGGAVSGDGY